MSTQDSLRQDLATRLKLAREMAGLTQAQVARQLGWHRPTVSEIEAGRRRVLAGGIEDSRRTLWGQHSLAHWGSRG